MVTYERLHEVLKYDPEIGLWTWLARTGKRMRVGDMAGRINGHGYREVRVDGQLYKTSRLAFLYMTGEWPAALVDHKDMDKGNDRWDNLRHATHSTNHANAKAHADNRSGVKGITHSYTKWQAQIGVNGKTLFLGRFATKEEAAEAYACAAAKYFGEFARIN